MAARKPKSFYSDALDEAERLELKHAAALDGIDDEIAVIRVQIKKLVKTADIEELATCMTVLCRLVSTRYATTKADKRGIKEAIGNVLRDIALPLGFNKNEVSVSLIKH
jgi:hypothetical protein